MSFLNSIFGGKPDYSQVKSPYQQIEAITPGIKDTTKLAESNIDTYLHGLLPPDVMNTIKRSGAAWGVHAGMPGSMAAENVTLESLGLSSLNLQQQGQSDYINFVTGLGSQMMPVSTQMQEANAAAAPNPVAAGLMGLGMFGIGTAASYYGGTGGSASTATKTATTSAAAPDAGFFSGFNTDSFGYGGDYNSPFSTDSLYN